MFVCHCLLDKMKRKNQQRYVRLQNVTSRASDCRSGVARAAKSKPYNRLQQLWQRLRQQQPLVVSITICHQQRRNQQAAEEHHPSNSNYFQIRACGSKTEAPPQNTKEHRPSWMPVDFFSGRYQTHCKTVVCKRVLVVSTTHVIHGHGSKRGYKGITILQGNKEHKLWTPRVS